MKAFRVLPAVFAVFFFCQASLVFAQGNLEKKFVLGPGDTIEISVWREDTLQKNVQVRPDGKISFPLIGDIQAEGRTVEELRIDIQEKISEYVPDSPVSVILNELNSSRAYVIGKVASPGVVLLTGNIRIMQALAIRGGLTTFAGESDINLIREVDGVQKVYEFDYDDVADGDDLEQNLVLQPGDTIVVP